MKRWLLRVLALWPACGAMLMVVLLFGTLEFKDVLSSGTWLQATDRERVWLNIYPIETSIILPRIAILMSDARGRVWSGQHAKRPHATILIIMLTSLVVLTWSLTIDFAVW